ncbi:serine hydrolase domain-containing protein [Pedobacter ginsengisoli]|uniref:serine hydrolase domain-containing protein n=1 Tax=Pedobacter ginsengisoli TaxID=363852 RepID=UPI00254AFFC7|nr:serine hydrolase domain-containing protein [Pedobacter ginsengisoli]
MKISKSTITLSAVLLLNTSFAKAQDASRDLYIQKLGKEYVRSPEAMGLSVGIFYQGKPAQYHFGTISKNRSEPPTGQTVYELGSITKVFASTLLANAVLEHKVSLDDDIRKYLPGKYPNLVYKGHPVKLVHLANLTSGLPNWIPDADSLFQSLPQDSIPQALIRQHKNFSKQQFYKELQKVTLSTEPGITPKHSNAAAQMLGFILEEVYQKPFENLVNRYITGPLKMKQTVLQPAKTKLLATGYNDKGVIMPYITTPDLRSSSELVSSITDMLKFLQYELDTANKAVKLTQQATVFNPSDTVALNWHVAGEGPSGYLWHTGGTFGFSSYVVLVPAQKLGLIFLANVSDAATQTKLDSMAADIIKYLNTNQVH